MTETRHSSGALAPTVGAAAIAIAVIAVAVILLTGSSAYTVHAQFADASLLVGGDVVAVAGRPVGTVEGIGVTPSGLADVSLSISDASITPLHLGTRAIIRALGQAGVANHYVQLTLGPDSAPPLKDGGVLPPVQTESMVNLDSILDSFGPNQRASLQQLITDGALIYAGSGARLFSRLLARLSPAFRQINGLAGQLAVDDSAVADVIRTGAIDADALASRSSDLTNAVANTATTMSAIASRRHALADAFGRTPGVLDEATATLKDAATAVTALQPALHEVPPAAGPLHNFLEQLNATLPQATPVVAQLRGELPGLRASLSGLKPLAPIAVRAIRSAGTALRVARPIVTAARYYGSDLLLGVFQGLAGVATANYDRWGHYARLEFTQPYQTSLGGPLSSIFAKPLLPSLFNLRTRLLRRCPGGNSPPAPDGSNPWIPNGSLCTPADDTPLAVDFP
jgi:phospholipid/cholesterol/gamma-HCH transport system substrate-binding protein